VMTLRQAQGPESTEGERTPKIFASRLAGSRMTRLNQKLRIKKQATRSVPPAIAHLVDSLMPFAHPSGLQSMSWLDSPSSPKSRPRGYAHLCRPLPSGSIASPLH
jgi:hypothetical protein